MLTRTTTTSIYLHHHTHVFRHQFNGKHKRYKIVTVALSIGHRLTGNVNAVKALFVPCTSLAWQTNENELRDP